MCFMCVNINQWFCTPVFSIYFMYVGECKEIVSFKAITMPHYINTQYGQ